VRLLKIAVAYARQCDQRSAISRRIFLGVGMIEDTIHEMQWLLGSGADVAQAKLIRYVPIRFYLDQDRAKPYITKETKESSDERPPLDVEVMTDHIVDALGNNFQIATEFPIEYGSVIKRLWMKTTDKITQR
jgi:hypothetical protein